MIVYNAFCTAIDIYFNYLHLFVDKQNYFRFLVIVKVLLLYPYRSYFIN